MLPWFSNGRFLLYLAPMAGVSDKIFRQLCKERGADVLVTEFVSSEGVFRRNARTRGYLDFDEIERPIGIQLFGGNAEHMAEAARQVVDWVQPDFIDLNFGCPVNKVVAKNGGSALLKDCPTLGRVAEAVVRAVTPLPVTAKIRTGWDNATINAIGVAQLLESLGIAALAVHGRTRARAIPAWPIGTSSRGLPLRFPSRWLAMATSSAPSTSPGAALNPASPGP
jgi:tRNA-dihydrouridine synthase